MDPRDLKELLDKVSKGVLSPDEAAARLATLPYEDLGFAKLDHHRALRRGFPEAVFGAGKTPEQILAI
ncbi:MAG TPA: 1-(5-phosphoribosyl)-5-amino-4-imidazole-carboxylate carboxylase, partial [Vicinamibacteria bacterium]